MFKSEYALYLGREDNIGVTDFVANNHYFIILEFNHDVPKEATRERVDKLKQGILQGQNMTLEALREIVDKVMVEEEKVEDKSLCVGFIKDDIFYLLTRGKGAIYIKRGNVIEMIVNGDNLATGRVQKGDVYLFASGNFQSLVTIKDINEYLNYGSPKKIVENITPYLKEKEQQVSIAMYIGFDDVNEPIIYESYSDLKDTTLRESYPNAVKTFINTSLSFLKNRTELNTDRSKSKKLTIIALAILIAIFIWSVVFGYQRRLKDDNNKKLENYRTSISSLIKRAEENSVVNSVESLEDINKAEEQLILFQEFGKDKIKEEVVKYKSLISEAKKKIEKKEEAEAEEVYDLVLINEKASSSRMFFIEGYSVVLDKTLKTVYVIDPEKKSHEDYTNSNIQDSEYVSYYNGSIYLYSKKRGVLKSKNNSEFIEAVPKDDEVKGVKGFWVYNGNIYILATGNDEIYKYLVAEGGYGGKTSYFQLRQSIDLAGANSFSIDSSVYIGFSTNVVKYASGVKESFNLSLPKGSFSFDKIYTNKDVNNVYLLDKTQGTLIVTNKKGDFVKQVVSKVFKNTDDFGATEEFIYALSNNKIYKLKY